MGIIDERLAHHGTVCLDSAVFIYHVEAHPRYISLTTELLAGIEAGRWNALTSTITLMELTVHPWRNERPEAAREYEALLAHFPHLALCDVTRDVARQAAQLRAIYRLRPADALQAATGLVGGATAFITNDRELTRLASLIDILLLEDLL